MNEDNARFLSGEMVHKINKLDDNSQNAMEKELDAIISATTKLSFGFFVGDSKKEAKILEEKENTETKINAIMNKYCLSNSFSETDYKRIWEKSQKVASAEFRKLSSELKLNSFYFQEVMHEYAVRLIQQALSKHIK